MRQIQLIVLLLIVSSSSFSQNVVRRNDTIAVFHKTHQLKLAWASGINSAQISRFDFNNDGLKDLFVLEPNLEVNYETGDKIYPFINLGGTGKTEYKYAPEYRSGFPALEEFALLRDYNCDGKEDIFTRDVRSFITVYKNTSTSTEIKFELAKKFLSTDTSGIPFNPAYFHYGNIYWGYPDLISITDVDGDGDLDLLTPAVNPHFIEYNKNMSLEYYGTCDSLVFKLKNTCWGQFLEDTGNVTLNQCDIVNVPNPESTTDGKHNYHPNNKSGRHSQDAMLALDLNGDGVMDLLEGDAGRQYLYSFINGGTTTSSHITSFTETYPAVDTFRAEVYAQPFYEDVNNDNKRDLLVSVYTDRMRDTSSVWYYKDVSTTNVPNFQLQTKGFLQEEMIDVGTQSKPVFFDYNQDSLMDIVVGNYGYFDKLGYTWTQSIYTSQLALYKNIGTKSAPAFELVDLNFANLDTLMLNVGKNKPVYACHPTFGDLDNDGDKDMIIGDYRGKIHYFTNDPVGGEAKFNLDTPELLGIDVGDFATPQLFDLDEDGKLDLIIGESSGNFNYYRNTSTTVLDFTLMDDSLGNINVKDDWDWYGYSAPFFFKDSLGKTKLLSGSKTGFISFFDSIFVGGVVSTQFRKIEKRFQDLWDGIYSVIDGADIDNDGQLDFILGNQSGGLTIYTSLDSVYKPDGLESIAIKHKTDYMLYPNPTDHEITLKIKCQCTDQFEYSVFDVMGNMIEQFTEGPLITINVVDYTSGIYFIRAQNKNRSIIITERFIRD